MPHAMRATYIYGYETTQRKLYRYIYRHCRKHGIRSTRSKYRNEAESYLSYCKKRKRKASRTRTLKHRITRLPERFFIQRDEIHREYGTLLQYTLDYPNVFPSSKRFLYKKRKCLMGGKSVSHRQHLPSLHTHTSYCKRQRNKVCRVQCKDQQHTDR